MQKPVRQSGDVGEPGGLVERTMAELRALIREEQLTTGDGLPAETALATRLGVSRAVIREAMRGLAALKILEVGNGRRARVAAPNAAALSMILDHTVYTRQLSVQQILDVRRTLELRTCALAALRRSDAQAEELRAIVDGMTAALDTAPDTVMEHDIRFHELIARASGNSLYSILVESFRVVTSQTWHIGWHARATAENRRENIRCHGRIAQAIADRDPIAAEKAMSEHFDGAVAVLLRAGVT